MQADSDGLTTVLDRTFAQLEQDGLLPSLEDSQAYTLAERRLLTEQLDCPDESVESAQRFAQKYSYEETERATYHAMESLILDLNTMHSRAGAQTPFSSLNYGTDTSPEGRMVIRSLLLAEQSGLGHGETPIFPIHIFKVKEGVNYRPEDPNYDLFCLACQVSAKRLFPNFSFLDAPYNLQYYRSGHPETEVAYMGCRTRVAANVYDPTREITTGRGNLSYTSINLPRLGLLANKNLDLFFELLDQKIDLVIQQLLDRFRIQGQKKVINFPFLMGQGVWLDSETLGPEDEVGQVLRHGTLTIGFIGLAETLVALIGQHHGQSEYAQNLGLEIIGHMRARMDAASEQMKLNFSLIATPAEGLSGRFVKIDRQRFGVIPGITDRDYYTNSFHIPVYYDINALREDSPGSSLPRADQRRAHHLCRAGRRPLPEHRSLHAADLLYERGRHRLRLHQPPGRPRPCLRLHRHHRGRVSPLPPPRNCRATDGAHPPHHRLSGQAQRDGEVPLPPGGAPEHHPPGHGQLRRQPPGPAKGADGMSAAAPVNRILPLSTVDGPGCRAAVFLQGCNLACAYCHNPETQNLCTGCGACVPACPAGALSLESGRVRWAAERCAGCDTCIRLCPRFASPKVTVMTASEVLSALAPSRPFIRGLTVSGGECTLYPDFLTELFTLARAGGLGCLLDSNGMVPLAPLTGLMAVCDGVMLDVKAWEPVVHRALTGADNAPVKENLAFLSACGKLAEVRVVCAPDAVDVEAVLDGVAAALGPRAPSTPVKLITFRPNGVRGALAGRPSPTPEQMTAWRAYALSAGLGAVLLR